MKDTETQKKRKLFIAIVILSVLGLIDAIALAILYYHSEIISPEFHKVHTSEYATLFGIPIAFFGVVAYALILVSIRPSRRDSCSGEPEICTTYIISLIGTLFSARLMYVSIFRIGIVCPFCTISAIIMLAILLLSLIEMVKRKGLGLTVTCTLFLGLVISIVGFTILTLNGTKTTKGTIQSGEFQGCSYVLQTTGCGCSSTKKLTLTKPNAPEGEYVVYYDADKNDDIGSSDDDTYTEQKGDFSITYRNSGFTVIGMRIAEARDNKEVIKEANQDYQTLLNLIEKEKKGNQK